MVLNDKLQELNVGDRWYVRIGASAICEMKIIDLSQLTVQLEEMPRSHLARRYEIKQINFIERLE